MLYVTDRSPSVRPELVARLRTLPTAVLADAMSAVRAVHGLHCLAPSPPGLGGVAMTAQLPPGDNVALHKAVDLARPGDVLMVDAGAHLERAVLGEIVARHAVARGVAGIVVDGAVRDSEALGELPIPIWCRGVSPLRPNRSGPGAVGTPITVGGCAVSSGDVVVGDGDGIVVVSARMASAVAASADQILRDDERRAAAADRLELDRSWLEHIPTRRL